MNPSQAQARKMVLVSTMLLAVLAVYRGKQGESTLTVFKRIWGTGVIGLVLSLAADFAPQVAGPFAVLVLLGSLTNGGDQVIQQALGKVTRTDTSTGTAGTAGGNTTGASRGEGGPSR